MELGFASCRRQLSGFRGNLTDEQPCLRAALSPQPCCQPAAVDKLLVRPTTILSEIARALREDRGLTLTAIRPFDVAAL
jgi:hypothetical protein